jgi:hypothetical protein
MNHTLTIRPAWTPLTIALMVLGFMVFWPLGLAMLAYILWGDRLPEFGRGTGGVRRNFSNAWGCNPRARETGNIAFDEYRERELKRLEEERRRLEEERREFETYVRNLRRAKDQEEFDRFMAERRASRSAGQGPAVDL